MFFPMSSIFLHPWRISLSSKGLNSTVYVCKVGSNERYRNQVKGVTLASVRPSVVPYKVGAVSNRTGPRPYGNQRHQISAVAQPSINGLVIPSDRAPLRNAAPQTPGYRRESEVPLTTIAAIIW